MIRMWWVRQGMVWSLCGRACRKGVVTIPAQEVSSVGGRHSQKEVIYGTHLAESYIPCTHLWQPRQGSHKNTQPSRSQAA